MKVFIEIIACEESLISEIRNMLSDNAFIINIKAGFNDVEVHENQLLICPYSYFYKQINLQKKLPDTPFLIITNKNKFLDQNELYTADSISLPIIKEELEFRIKNLIHSQIIHNNLREQNEKLRKFFEKNRRKTVDLFGKHIDLKKAQKEIQVKNVKLEHTIEKKNIKTVELFGKHIDLKKVQKEILDKKKQIEKQKSKIEMSYEKKKRKTIELFGKHIDLKKAKKELSEKNEILTKVLEKNRQKTIDLFGKHIDLKKAKKEISDQKAQIEKQNNSITDSIKYASFIQSAVLPREERIKEILPKHMIIYMPRDIVSGDFYWIEEIGDKLYLAAADCTGHGVPGAFMSMLGISLLNEIVNRYKNRNANDILELLRDKVIFSLHQTGRMDEAADGMDISFCIINKKTLEMQFSGAHNPVYIIRKGEIIEIKGDRMPIGFSLRINKPFNKYDFQLEKGDRIYIFSDGYADQFGGEHGMKMRYKLFQQYLLETLTFDFDRQEEYLVRKFMEWKGNYNQIDDLLILGFEIG